MRQLIHRVTRTITDWGIADGYFADAEAAEIFYDELTWLCVNQHGAFNSPVWFNVGLVSSIRRRQGRGRGQLFLQSRDRPGASAPRRSTNIRRAAPASSSAWRTRWKTSCAWRCSEAMLFKYGSGTGTDLSSLRSTREKLSGGGKPSGPLSFLKVYDQVANVVKIRRQDAARGEDEHAQGLASATSRNSSTRRQKEEKKAWALIEQGYDGSYNGDAYGSVMYQNENLSRARERRIHGRGDRRPRMVDARA